MADQTITFNFAGSGSQLVSETKKILAELGGIGSEADKTQEAFNALEEEIKQFSSGASQGLDEVAIAQANLKTKIFEQQASGAIGAKQAQDLIRQAELAGYNQRIALAEQKVKELKKINETASDPKTLADLGKAELELANLRQSAAQLSIDGAEKTTEANNRAGISVQALAAKYYLIVQALQAVLAAGRSVYGTLIAQNVELENQLLGTQASLASTNKVIRGGVEIQDPTEAVRALEGPVDEAIERIRKKSLDLVGVTSKDLIPIFQNIAGQSGQIGANLEDSADLTIKFAAALGTLQVPLDQQRQEISSIIQGQITSDSILAKSLGLNNEMVRQWRAQGTVVEELNKRLERFAAGNALAAQTISGVASNIQEFFDNITLEAGAELTEQVAEDLNAIYKLLNDNRDEILNFVVTGVDFITALYNQVKEGGGQVLESLEPIGNALADIFDEDLLNTIELIFGGLLSAITAVTEQLANDPIFLALLKVVDAGILATGALANLGGAYGDAVDAAEIYRQQAEATSQQAVDTLGKIKRGEEGAALARTQSLEAIDQQLRTLKDANLVGTENRAVIRGQIRELEGWKRKLEEADGSVQLISNSTEQLTADLKLLQEQFADSSAEVELAQAQLNAAAQRQLADGVVNARDVQKTTLEIERSGLDERLALAREKVSAIADLQSKGGDAEQQKTFARERVKAEQELAQVELQIAKNRIAQRQRLEQIGADAIAFVLGRAEGDIAQAVAERELQTQEALNQGLIREKEAAEERLQIRADQIRDEIDIEKTRASELEKLQFANPEQAEANEEKIRASRKKTTDLTIQLLEVERNIEMDGIKAIQKAIADQAQEEKNQAEARTGQLEDQLRRQDLLNEAVDRSNKLAAAQRDLASAQRSNVALGGQIELDNLSRALELRKRLNEENLDPKVREVIEEQLKLLTGKPDTSEAEILAQRIVRENELQRLRRETLAIEQDVARNALDLELQRNKLASERLVIETQIGQLNAQQALSEAQARRDELATDPNADSQQIRNADAAIARAQAGVGLADRSALNAQENLAQQDTLAVYARRTLSAQQQAAVAQFEAADAAREQANQLAIAEAKADGIVERLEKTKRASFSQTFADQIERNDRLLPRSRPIQDRTPALPQATSVEPLRQTQEANAAQLDQLRQLVGLNQRLTGLADGLSAQLLRIAERPQTQNQITNNIEARGRILAGTGL